jgi:hypothetical protein
MKVSISRDVHFKSLRKVLVTVSGEKSYYNFHMIAWFPKLFAWRLKRKIARAVKFVEIMDANSL